MTFTRRSLLRAGCGLFAGGFLAGCVGNSPSDEQSSGETEAQIPPETTQRETSTGTESRSTTTSGERDTVTQQGPERACNGATSLSFYALNIEQLWNQTSVQVGFYLGANARVLLVAYENDTVLGVAQYQTPSDTAVNVDGLSIPLDRRLIGEHTIRVVMYGDVNGNGQFDTEADSPCRHEGSVIQAGPETINFSRFAGNTTTTP